MSRINPRSSKKLSKKRFFTRVATKAPKTTVLKKVGHVLKIVSKIADKRNARMQRTYNAVVTHFNALKYFRSQIDPNTWKKMSKRKRAAHKSKQAFALYFRSAHKALLAAIDSLYAHNTITRKSRGKYKDLDFFTEYLPKQLSLHKTIISSKKGATFDVNPGLANKKLLYFKPCGGFTKLLESQVIETYSESFLPQKITMRIRNYAPTSIAKPLQPLLSQKLERKGYIKHVVRMRYRWHFQPKLLQFKLFKKFFKRSLKRYRKISKNRLFINKFRSHFSKLTGFTERGLMQYWLPLRRSGNQYWSGTNAATKFSQSLLLAPTSFLILLQLAPSIAASKYLIKSGSVSINGATANPLVSLLPGDILQVGAIIRNRAQQFFDYQKWQSQYYAERLSFLQVDRSSGMYMLLKWPRKYELIAPSFLSERWIRYYIRQFPSKIRNFKKISANWKQYKEITTKR